MDFDLKELSQYIKSIFKEEIVDVKLTLDELDLSVRRDSIMKTLTFLRDNQNCQMKQLVDICGIDYPEQEDRFCIVYNLLSLTHNSRVRVRVWTNEDEPIPSIVKIFSSANWYEREIWDLFGVYFAGHPDLRRILNDYGFEGHPLRKDFPLSGYVEIRYDEESKRVVYEPVKLTQEFRTFDFLSPWEGNQGIIQTSQDIQQKFVEKKPND